MPDASKGGGADDGVALEGDAHRKSAPQKSQPATFPIAKRTPPMRSVQTRRVGRAGGRVGEDEWL